MIYIAEAFMLDSSYSQYSAFCPEVGKNNYFSNLETILDDRVNIRNSFVSSTDIGCTHLNVSIRDAIALSAIDAAESQIDITGDLIISNPIPLADPITDPVAIPLPLLPAPGAQQNINLPPVETAQNRVFQFIPNPLTVQQIDLIASNIEESENIEEPLTIISDNQLLPRDLNKIKTLQGTLRADTFTIEPGYNLTIISGNGNVDFGSGSKDLLDLSYINYSSINLNLAGITDGGIIYDLGKGNRVFDAISFNDGNQILFEGIDTVKFADGTLELSVIPNDPLFNKQWNLHSMGVHNAWAFTTGINDVLMGIQDTGLAADLNNYIHPDLRNTFIFAPDNYRDDFTFGSISHGTSVQGIIAANSNNGIGMSGINWNSPVFNIDILGNDEADRDIIEAVQTTIDRAKNQTKRLIINFSLAWGNSFDQTNLLPTLNQLVADNQDVLFLIAAGNEGNKEQIGLSYPATLAKLYNNVISVGASWGTQDFFNQPTTPGERINYANWWGSQYGEGLTVMAPSEVVATYALDSGEFDYWANNKAGFNGTSAAVPNVTGIASLVWSANPNLTANQLKEIISQTAYDLGEPNYDIFYGYGFVNADAAVRRAVALSKLSRI